MPVPPGRTLSQTEQDDWPETTRKANITTIKPETASHVAEQFSWVPLPHCSPPRCPFPRKSFTLSALVSPWTTHFRVLDKSPLSGPGRGPPSCNRSSRHRAGGYFPSPPTAQDSWSTALLSHHQPIRRKSHTLQPSPQILPIKAFP